MKAHNISVKAFFKEENLEQGRLLFKELLPETAFEEERLEPEIDSGIFTKPIFILKAVISKQSQVDGLLKKIFSSLTESEKLELRNTIESRIDDECNLYLRLDKKALMQGKITLHTRDSVHVKIKIACFPKKKENAIKIALELLNPKQK